MKFYIYEIETNEVIEIVEGDTHDECIGKAEHLLDFEEYAATYTPAFGAVGGLKGTG